MFYTYRTYISAVFSEPRYGAIALGVSAGVLVAFGGVFLHTFTLYDFLHIYTPFYIVAAFSAVFLAAALAGIGSGLLAWLVRHRALDNPAHVGNGAAALFLGIMSADCPRCASFLAEIQGKGGDTIAIFPYHGLEVKWASVFLLAVAVGGIMRGVARATKKNQNRTQRDTEIPQLVPSKTAVAGVVAPALLGLFVFSAVLSLPEIVQGESMISVLQEPEKAPQSCQFK